MAMNLPLCRSCGAELRRTFVDLGYSPLANSFLAAGELRRQQNFYPLHAFLCDSCLLVQLDVYETAEQIFDHYLYFSSYSKSWLEHARRYAAQMIGQRGLGAGSLVVEVASNDGYLLQYFAERGIGVLGVEPAGNVAEAAIAKGIRTEIAYFGSATARRLVRDMGQADLMVANNVLAHVPALNDFVAGFKIMLKPQGCATFEFPHLQRLIEECQFDTIYHEHFSYFSLLVVDAIFTRHGLTIFDVEELPTHGGSLRIHAAHTDTAPPRSAGWRKVMDGEILAALDRFDGYAGFAPAVTAVKCRLLEFLVRAWQEGKTVAGYGAPAKGNTLLNYCGVGRELIPYTVDRSPHKQGRFLPGVQIPIYPPERIFETKPDYVLILPWNIQDEIRTKMGGIREWGGRFVVAVPSIAILD
jgi:2-polyprenyl-3-methyl-5-hydroxy-6-metoxy-1,4-benzoquinol methylase